MLDGRLDTENFYNSSNSTLGLNKPLVEYEFVNINCPEAGKVQLKRNKATGEILKCCFFGLAPGNVCARCFLKPHAPRSFTEECKQLATIISKREKVR